MISEDLSLNDLWASFYDLFAVGVAVAIGVVAAIIHCWAWGWFSEAPNKMKRTRRENSSGDINKKFLSVEFMNNNNIRNLLQNMNITHVHVVNYSTRSTIILTNSSSSSCQSRTWLQEKEDLKLQASVASGGPPSERDGERAWKERPANHFSR